MNPNGANYAFIDNENVNVSVQKQKWKIDRGKFREWLKTERNVEVAYMFMGYLEEYQPMYEFFTSLGYTLVFRPMNPNPDVPNKGNIDTDLVLQAMIDRPNYHQAVIVSGDGDFASLVKHLNEQKKLATVIVPNERRYSGFLNEASGDKIVSLSLLKGTLRYKPSAKKNEGSGSRSPKTKTSTASKPLLQHTSKYPPKRSEKPQTGTAQPKQTGSSNYTKSSNKAKLPATQPKQSAQKSFQTPPQKTPQTPPQKTPQRTDSSQQSRNLPKPPATNGQSKPRSTYKSNDDAFYA